MHYLVLGATGMAGHTIALYLQERGHRVTAFSQRGFLQNGGIVGDAMDRKVIIDALLRDNYDVVVNCIGVLNLACNSDPPKAIYLNSYLPHLIAETLNKTGSTLVHLSTDCVFSGDNAPYHEKDFRDSDSLYGRTKALGEVDDNRNLTFRNSIIGPDLRKEGLGLFNWFMKQTGVIEGYSQVMWTGVTSLTLAKAIEKASVEKTTGIYNLVNNVSISKYNLLLLFNEYFKDKQLCIRPEDKVRSNKSLHNNRGDFSFCVPSYESMIKEMLEWIEAHRNLYPHYSVTGDCIE